MVSIPPSEPIALVLYDIAAVGVPDADAAGGSDPYCRITCLDHDGCASARHPRDHLIAPDPLTLTSPSIAPHRALTSHRPAAPHPPCASSSHVLQASPM